MTTAMTSRIAKLDDEITIEVLDGDHLQLQVALSSINQ